MKEASVTVPELGLIAGTRVALGVGLGLLLGDLLSAEQRRAIGWTLLIFGAVSTVPLAFEVLGKLRSTGPTGQPQRTAAALPSGISERLGQRGVPAP
jgi:hypothetical protein